MSYTLLIYTSFIESILPTNYDWLENNLFYHFESR